MEMFLAAVRATALRIETASIHVAERRLGVAASLV